MELHAQPAPPFVPPPFSIRAPRPGQRVERAAAEQLVVTVEGGGEGLRVALDGHSFRSAAEGRIGLQRLLLEDEDLVAGPHRIVVLEDGPQGRAVAATWFWVDEGASPSAVASAPELGVVLVSPSGTYNGNRAADAILIDGFELEAFLKGQSAPVLVRVREEGPQGQQMWGQQTARGEILRPCPLGSGDYQVEMRSQKSNSPWASVTRTITINRDAPDPEEP